MSAQKRKLTVNFDGGSRGNPGPAAAAAIVSEPGGEVIEEAGELIGDATNNVAEYRALLLAIDRALAHGASEVELIGDSELIVRQVKGEWKVKDAGLRPLREQASEALGQFETWNLRNVPREQNEAADSVVNATLDGDD